MARCAPLLLLLLLLLPPLALGACPNKCSGHGKCAGVNRCACFAGWGGGDCSLKACPLGPSWADVASGEDEAHAPAPCSDRGTCDEVLGACACFPGFEGPACNRLSCTSDCSGRGECATMLRHAQSLDLGLLPAPAPHTLVRAPYAYTQPWDAEMVQGCTCDAGHAGAACEEKLCAVGDDPMTTGQVDEVQVLRCDIDPTDVKYKGNQFTLSFRGAVSKPFGTDASSWDIKQALEALPGVGTVEVAYTAGATFCNASYFAAPNMLPTTQPASGNVVSITFKSAHGALPALVVLDKNAAPLYNSALDNAVFIATGGDGLWYTTMEGSAIVTRVVISVVGTKESAPCSNRGRCKAASGVCECFPGFRSSDGATGAAGVVPDCGHAYLPITGCPAGLGGVECSGHGSCSGYPGYVCACDAGWVGGDCRARSCPAGRAWFDYPTADNTAHADAPCSGKGRCSPVSGECACEPGFEGAACERMTCPGTSAAGVPCSGNGQCLDMAALAAHSALNGDPEPTTYGADPFVAAVWDAHSARGCLCEAGWQGADCAARTCAFGNDIAILEADPTRGDEVQTLQCMLFVATTTPTATVTLSFRGAETAPMFLNATAEEVAAALSALPTTGGSVGVEFNLAAGTGICETPTLQTATISFHTVHGPLPPLRVVMDPATRDPITGEYGSGLGWTALDAEWTGGDPGAAPLPYAGSPHTFLKTPTFEASGVRALRSIPGTSGNEECSGRGLCDRVTGQCRCFLGYGASNNNRGEGTDENCGWRQSIPLGAGQEDLAEAERRGRMSPA